jgi:betaine-homocysteine S-methyltransferase
MAKTGLLERLAQGFVLGDGGYLMGLRLRGFLRADSMTPEVVATHPEEVRRLAREFREAGAEVLQTLTFFGTANMLARAGFGDRAEEINRAACRIARQVAGQEALVAGNLNSPSIVHGDYHPGDRAKQERTRAWLEEQLPWILDEGVDFLILETFSWLDEALVALEVAQGAGLPLVVTVSMEGRGGRTLDGCAPQECARRLAEVGASVVGINCLWEPEKMLGYALAMRQAVEVPVCCQPSAWHSWWPQTRPVPPARFARFAQQAMQADIRYLGSCCGAGPEHVCAMARAMGKKTGGEHAG